MGRHKEFDTALRVRMTNEQYRALSELAFLRGSSLAETVRSLVDAAINQIAKGRA